MTTAHTTLVVMSAAAIDVATFEPLGPDVPATHTVLWHDEGSMAGVLVLEAGSLTRRASPRLGVLVTEVRDRRPESVTRTGFSGR